MNEEYELLYRIKQEILRYIGLKKKQENGNEQILYFDSFSGEKNFYMYRYSVATPLQPLRIQSFLSTTSTDSRLVNSFRKDSFSVDNTFSLLNEQYFYTGLVRYTNNKTEIHISLIKQYIFDCCVYFHIFYGMLLAPVHGKE